MNIKVTLLKKYGVVVPEGYSAMNVEEAVEGQKTGRAVWVVKAQIHAGGRGKAVGSRL
jgi:succinyl-CoA synthetase beta subunit